MQLATSRPMLFGLAAVMMWSTIAVGFKLGLRNMEPIQLLWIGSCFSWVLFSVCCAVLPSQPREASYISRACLLGLLNPLLYYIVLLTAYDLLPAHVAQPLNYTWAIVTALLAIPMLRQKLSRSTFIGILVGVLRRTPARYQRATDGFAWIQCTRCWTCTSKHLSVGNLLDLERSDTTRTMVVHVVRVYGRGSDIDCSLLPNRGLSCPELVKYWLWCVDRIARNGIRVFTLATSNVDDVKCRETKPAYLSIADDLARLDLHNPWRVDPLHCIHRNLHDFRRSIRSESTTCGRQD